MSKLESFSLFSVLRLTLETNGFFSFYLIRWSKANLKFYYWKLGFCIVIAAWTFCEFFMTFHLHFVTKKFSLNPFFESNEFTNDKLSLMITYTQMNSMAVQKVDTSTTKGPNENQSRTFLLGILSVVATKNFIAINLFSV